jgi:uncharacterized protein (DUF1501 family)
MFNPKYTLKQSRREFLKAAGRLSVAGSAAPFALNLAAIGNAAAQSVSDYKAVVCLFMYGANDHNNTVIPFDAANYNTYSTIRSGIARTTAELVQLTPTAPLTGSNAGRQFALPTELNPLKSIWDEGKMAILANVGPLIVPTTKAQYNALSVPLPPKLFSHNDQQSVWQASAPEGARVGWGGKMGDMMASNNSAQIFTCNSVAGAAVFITGNNTIAYQLSSSGSTTIGGLTGTLFGSSSAPAALRSIITGGGTNLFTQDLADTTQRSIDANVQLSGALAGAPDLPLPSTLTSSSLGAQLRLVARMISQRSLLGAKRQVFMVSLGGFDTHDNQLPTQPNLHTQIGNAIKYFYDSMKALGVSDSVTLFTASDFGRTLSSNGDGSDHGWGSHHFIVGGSVLGQRYYGTFPIMGLNNNDEVGSGRLLPTTSVDQFAATIARWFGVGEGNLELVVPNLRNFSNTNIGFMA